MKTNKYESMYIVRPDVADGDLSKLIQRFQGVIEEKGGTVTKAEKYDKRKLAYEIKGQKEGIYINMLFECDTQIPKELSRLMHINDDIIRHRIFTVED